MSIMDRPQLSAGQCLEVTSQSGPYVPRGLQTSSFVLPPATLPLPEGLCGNVSASLFPL